MKPEGIRSNGLIGLKGEPFYITDYSGTKNARLESYKKEIKMLISTLRVKRGMIRAFVFLGAVFFFIFFPLTEAGSQEAIHQQTQNLGMPFSLYQKSLDDLIHIAITTHPDPSFGINQVIVKMNRTLSQNPQDVKTLMNLGHMYRLLGQPQEAARYYEKALDIQPNHYHLNIFAGITSFQNGKLVQALEEFSHAVSLNPRDPDVWAMRGRTLLGLERIPEAISSYEQAVKLNPDHPESVYLLSLLYQKNGQTDAAIKTVEHLIAAQPQDKYARFHLGVLYLLRKEAQKALPLFDQLYLEGVREPQFLFHYVIASIETKNYSKSEIILKHLQFFYPDVQDIDFMMAELYRKMGRLNEAEQKYREIIALDPDDTEAKVGLALTLKERGKLKEGLKVLKEAKISQLRLAPGKNQATSLLDLHL